MITLIQVFRNSVGDISIFSGDGWQKPGHDDESEQYIVAYIVIFLIWFVNCIVMIIIMLNFLIAEVSKTYERVRNQGEMLLYKKKAELNVQAYMVADYFSRILPLKCSNQYVALVFSTEKKQGTSSSNDDQESSQLKNVLNPLVLELFEKMKINIL